MSLNNGYEESNTGDNQVVYNGNLVSYDSVPVADFNNPLKISLNMDFTHQPSGLVWANTLARQEARKARIILGKTNAQYISEYSDYKQYVDEKLDSSLTGTPACLDATISETTKPDDQCRYSQCIG